MKRRTKASIFCLTLVLDVVCSLPVSAQSEGSLAASFVGSTRAAALGGAGAALVGDAGAVFANPAAIAPIRRLSLEGSYEAYIGGAFLSSAAVAARVGRFTWGAGVLVLDYGSEPELVPDPASGGRRGTPTGATFHPYDGVAVSSFVYRHSLFALGVSGKYARQQVGAWIADAWAGDVGLAIAVFDLMAVGVSVQNLGGDLGEGARLPRRTRAGFTLNYVDPQGTFRLLTSLEALWPASGTARVLLGVESGIVVGGPSGVGLVGRMGYTSLPAGHDASRVTLGGGVELGRVHLDYAFRAWDALGGGTHRVGLRWTP